MSIISMLPYILGAQAVILAVVGTWLIYHFKLRIVYKAEFYRETGKKSEGSKRLVKVGSKEFKPDAKEIRYKGSCYPIRFDKMVYSDGRKSVWAFELNKKIGLTYGGSHDAGDPDFAEDLLYSGVIKRFVSLIGSITATTWLIIVLLVVVAVLAFVSGLFSSPYILPSVGASA